MGKTTKTGAMELEDCTPTEESRYPEQHDSKRVSGRKRATPRSKSAQICENLVQSNGQSFKVHDNMESQSTC